MEPLFCDGDTLLIQKTDPQSLYLGDVVVFEAGGENVSHRLVGKKHVNGEIRLVTQSDNKLSRDFGFGPCRLVGKVKYVMRDGRCLPLDGFWCRLYAKAMLAFILIDSPAYQLACELKWRIVGGKLPEKLAAIIEFPMIAPRLLAKKALYSVLGRTRMEK